MVVSGFILPLICYFSSVGYSAGTSEKIAEIDEYVNETRIVFGKYDKEFREASVKMLISKRDSIGKNNPDTLKYEYFTKSFDIWLNAVKSTDSTGFYPMNYYSPKSSKDGNAMALNINQSDCENYKAFYYDNEIRILMYEFNCSPVFLSYFRNGKLIFTEVRIKSEQDSVCYHKKIYFKNGKKSFAEIENGKLSPDYLSWYQADFFTQTAGQMKSRFDEDIKRIIKNR